VFSFIGGDGSSGSPYLISNCTHLQNMSTNLSAYYVLNNSINCGLPPYNTGERFKPVGNNSCGVSCRFSGNFNGNNYTISNLFINRSSEDDVGLFG
jgi:hypothetical protein